MGNIPSFSLAPTVFNRLCISPFDDLFHEPDVLLLLFFILLQFPFEVVKAYHCGALVVRQAGSGFEGQRHLIVAMCVFPYALLYLIEECDVIL